ncbi:MAG: hypothetical protein AAGD18_10805 [Actinomycetota bacterium]
MTTLVTVLIAVGVALLLIGLLAMRWLRGARAGAIAAGERLLGGWEPVVVDTAANCFGLASSGPGQVRGNGYLAATEDVVVFVMWVPRREVKIPRPLVVEATTTRSHLGKTVNRDLLHLRWIAEDGSEEDSAFAVRNLGAWLDELG